MDFNKIRELIIKNHIEEALQLLHDSVEIEFRTDVILLMSQFSNWEDNYRLNLGASMEERNRIIYATLHLVSQLEKESKKGLEAKRVQSLAYVEADLAKGYEKLASLKSNGAIDLFMIWFMKRKPETFRKLLEEEKINGKAISFIHVLSNTSLHQFASENKLNATPQSIYEYLLHKSNEIPMFFSGWLEYSNYKERFAIDLKREIEKYEQRHKSLLKTGVFGAIIGGVTFNILERTMDKVIELHESGSIDSDNSNFDDDDDDD